MPTTIVRSPKDPDHPYAAVDKRLIEDPTLSWKAKGLMSYLLSRPDNWEIRVADLVNRSPDGETAVRSGIQELEAHGYLVRRRLHDPQTGRFTGYRLIVYEHPLPPDDAASHDTPSGEDPAPREDTPQTVPPRTASPQTVSPRTGPPPPASPAVAFPDPGHPSTGSRPPTKTNLTKTDLTKPDDVDVPPYPPIDPVLAQIVALYEQEIGGCLTAMIHDELTDLVTHECRDPDRWRAAFRASIGARNRWHYTRAVILHPERKPPKEVQPYDNATRQSRPHRGARRSSARAAGYTLPTREEIDRVNREAAAQLGVCVEPSNTSVEPSPGP